MVSQPFAALKRKPRKKQPGDNKLYLELTDRHCEFFVGRL
jgi:hypothetical protein